MGLYGLHSKDLSSKSFGAALAQRNSFTTETQRHRGFLQRSAARWKKPQGLKPFYKQLIYGTAEAVPFQGSSWLIVKELRCCAGAAEFIHHRDTEAQRNLRDNSGARCFGYFFFRCGG